MPRTKTAPNITASEIIRRQRAADKKLNQINERSAKPLVKSVYKILTRHGHPRFYELTALEEDLHSRKNEDYAGGGRAMGNFERVSTFLAMFPGFPLASPHGVALVYMLKQLDAALWLLATKREGKVEGVADRLGDIGVYAKLARIMYEESITPK